MYLGDYAEDYADLNFKFTTRDSTGAPTTLSGTPAISVYKSNDTTQSTAGVTLTVDFDSVTGLNNVKIDLSADAFYATGEDYSVVITTGTVDGTSVVGEVVATFSIENRYTFASGADLTAIPWNAAWDAEVQSEVNDGLVALGLDHLVAASVAGADVVDNSIFAKIVSSSATADWDDFVNTTDSLQANRDALPTEADNSAIAFISTVASYSSDTITLNDTPNRADEFNTLDVVVVDSTGERYSGYVLDTVVSPNPQIVLSSTPAFTPASTDKVVVYTTRTNFMKATTDSILADTGTDGVVVAAGSKTGYALSSTGLDLVIPADPNSTLPTLGTSSLPAWIGCFAAVMINEANATSSQISIRNTGDSANLITYASITDDGTTLTVPAGS